MPQSCISHVSLLFLYGIVLVITVAIFVTRNYSVIVIVAAGFDAFIYGFVGYAALRHHRK